MRSSEAAAAAAAAATQMNYPRKDGAEERMDWSPFQMGAFTLLEWSNLAVLLGMTLHRRSPKHPHLGPEVKMQRMLRIL